MHRPERADLESKLGPACSHFAARGPFRFAGTALTLALLIAPATSSSLAEEPGEPSAGTPEVYVNTELLERLATEDPATLSSAEGQPQSLLQTPPDWQLESRLYVVPLDQAGPAEPALAPPAPSILTSELKALEGGRATPVSKEPPLVKPRAAPPRPAETAVAQDPEVEVAPPATGAEAQASQAPSPAPTEPPGEAEIPPAAPTQVTAELHSGGEEAASVTPGPQASPPEAQVAPRAPLPTEAPSEVETPAATPPEVTAELRSRDEKTGPDTPGPQVLVPEPPKAAPAAPPQAPGDIDIPAIKPPPAAAAAPDPEPEIPAAATGSDAPPPAALILDELAEAVEREAPKSRKIVAPPVPEPPPPLAPDAEAPAEMARADEVAPAAPPAPDPEERLGPAPASPTTGDSKRQIAARSPAQAPFEGRILFEAGSTELSPEARGVLEGLAERLKAADAEGVELRAYATGKYSRRLSLSRGLVAQSYLEKLGVQADTVFLRPLGDKATDGPSERIDFELVTP